MKKLPPHLKGAKNVPFIQISLGRTELNALMYALEQNQTVQSGFLEDSSLDLMTKILKTGRFQGENKERNHNELVSLQFWGDEITFLLQHFVATSCATTENEEDIPDYFESIKQEKLDKKSDKKSKEKNEGEL